MSVKYIFATLLLFFKDHQNCHLIRRASGLAKKSNESRILKRSPALCLQSTVKEGLTDYAHYRVVCEPELKLIASLSLPNIFHVR